MKLLKISAAFLVGALVAWTSSLPREAAAQATKTRAARGRGAQATQAQRGAAAAQWQDEALESPADAGDFAEPIANLDGADLQLLPSHPALRSVGPSANAFASRRAGGTASAQGVAQKFGIDSNITVDVPSNLSDAVAEERTRFDLAAKGLPKDFSADPITVNLEDGRTRAFLQLRKEERYANATQRALLKLPSVQTVGKAAFVGLGTFVASVATVGTAFADSIANEALKSQAFSSFTSLIGSGALYALPPAIAAALPSQIMNIVEGWIYKEVDTTKKRFNLYSDREFALLSESDLLFQYGLMRDYTVLRYGKKAAKIFKGLYDPAKLPAVPKEEHKPTDGPKEPKAEAVAPADGGKSAEQIKTEREDGIRQIRRDAALLNKELERRESIRTRVLSSINFLVAVALGFGLSLLQFHHILSVDPTAGDIFGVLITTGIGGVGASWLWNRSRTRAEEARTAGPKSGGPFAGPGS